MEVQEAIFGQVVAKQFLGKSVEMEKIDAIVRAGNAVDFIDDADIHFMIITNAATRSYIDEQIWAQCAVSDSAALRIIAEKRYSVLSGAPVLIVVSAPPMKKFSEFQQTNAVKCAYASQNMVLAATGLKLGSCLMPIVAYVLNTDEVRSRIGIPETDSVYNALLVGYANQGTRAKAMPQHNVRYIS